MIKDSVYLVKYEKQDQQGKALVYFNKVKLKQYFFYFLKVSKFKMFRQEMSRRIYVGNLE
jgi:hypothetical protein